MVKEALQPQEFLKIQQYKEKSRLWENNSLLISDFEQKKYFDLGSINKDDCNIRDYIGVEMDYPKRNCNDQVARAAYPKELSDFFEKEVHVEEYSRKQKEK